MLLKRNKYEKPTKEHRKRERERKKQHPGGTKPEEEKPKREQQKHSVGCTLLNQTKPFSLCWFVLSFSLSFSFSFKFSFRKYNYLLQIHGRSVRNNAANCRPRTRRNLFIFKPIYTQFIVVVVFLFFRSAGGSPPFRPIGWPLCSWLFFCWSQFL